MEKNYAMLGAVLITLGTLVSLSMYFFAHSIPLTAIGIAAIVLGLGSSLLPQRLSGSSAMSALLKSSFLGTEAILEELSSEGVELPVLEQGQVILRNTEESSTRKDRAIYLPPSNKGLVHVFLPLGSGIGPGQLELMTNAPNIFSYLKGDKERGLKIIPVGAGIGMLLRNSLENEGLDLEERIRKILIDSAELCTSLYASELENMVVLELNNPTVELQSGKYSSSLGTIPCSLAASIIATIRNRPVTILDELQVDAKGICRFRLE